MFALAADGKTNKKGMPGPLRLAVIANHHFDVVRLPLRSRTSCRSSRSSPARCSAGRSATRRPTKLSPARRRQPDGSPPWGLARAPRGTPRPVPAARRRQSLYGGRTDRIGQYPAAMSTETFSRSFRGYRRSEVDTAKMRSDLRIEQLEYELSNMTQRANAMQVEIRDLYGRIDELRERERSLAESLDEMRARRDQTDREAESRARQLMLAAEERSATLKTEGLRQVGELQRQVEQLLGMRTGLTHALQRLSEDIAGAMARVAAAPGDGDRPPGRASRRALGRRAPRLAAHAQSASPATPSTSCQPCGSRDVPRPCAPRRRRAPRRRARTRRRPARGRPARTSRRTPPRCSARSASAFQVT